jgi:hypothetical protein
MSERNAAARTNRRDQIAGALLAVLGGYVAWASTEYPFGTVAEPGPGYLPFVLALVLAAFGLILILRGSVIADERMASFGDFPHALLLLIVLGAAAYGIERLGYRLTVASMLIVLLLFIERCRVWLSVAATAFVALGSFYLINNVLRVPLPIGPWGL